MDKKKLVSKDGWCFKCGGNGFVDKDCPECGRAARVKSMNLEFREDADAFVTETGMRVIPDHYKGIVWSTEMLIGTKPDKEKDYRFLDFVKGLEKINSVFSKGVLSRQSAIIIAPAGYSKMTFAYSCMQRAIDNGFSVAPLLDTVEIKRLLTLAGDNPNYKVCKTMSYDDYIMSDVLFATVTKLAAREWAFEVIQELIDRRARKGLSTFIISRYDLAEISRRITPTSFQ